jgi:ketosteroid isomerase-like protein
LRIVARPWKEEIAVEHPNAQLMRRSGELLNAGDFQGFLALHTDDVVMHVPGTSPLAGDHRGRDGVAAVFQKEMSLLDAPPEFEDHDDLGSDQHAVKLVTQRLRRGGRTFEGRQTMVAHVRDGKFSEIWFQPEDQAAFDDFFS